MSPTSVETEIKLKIRNRRSAQARLRRLGFRTRHARCFESNTLLDNTEAGLRSSGKLLRLREFGNACVVTYKGPGIEGKYKTREELEITVNDLGTTQQIFARLGFTPAFRYEKYRTELEDGEGVATIDETPIGNYLELEGAPDWIDRRAGELGFAEKDYVTRSYGRLYLDYCEERGERVGDMLLGRNPDRTSKKSP